MSAPSIIYADPIRALAAELRTEAAMLRDQRIPAAADLGAQLERMAERVEAAIEAGDKATWVPVSAAARLARCHPETIRVRCRKVLKPRGLARKVGGDWQLHVSALAA